jgi:hypothetical protein
MLREKTTTYRAQKKRTATKSEQGPNFSWVIWVQKNKRTSSGLSGNMIYHTYVIRLKV